MVQVNTPLYYTLRIRFKKIGSLQYISHLDLVRTMNKIIVRAGFPLWYSEGFNPKPKMIFAAPLSIGTESISEFMDLRITEKIDPEDAKRRLNEKMTDELQVISAYYPETKLTELKWLSYDMNIFTNGASDDLVRRCDATLKAERIMIVKTGKSGVPVEVDIKPLIRSSKVTFEDGMLKVNCVLSADSSSFLNPERIISVLKDECGILSDTCIVNEWYSIMRKEAFCEDMSLFN